MKKHFKNVQCSPRCVNEAICPNETVYTVDDTEDSNNGFAVIDDNNENNMTSSELTKAIKNINLEVVSVEVLQWLIRNVEEFIDNHEYIFRIDLLVDGDKETPELKKLQTLFQTLPSEGGDEKVEKDRKRAYKLLNKVLSLIDNNTELKNKLFERMSFFYEIKGYSPKSGLMLQKVMGEVSIKEFDYEAFSVGVKSSALNTKTGEKELVREYLVPEGFTILLEIAIIDDSLPRGLF